MVTARDDDLSRYRYHTGAALRRAGADERLPVLFRDLGTVALADYLRGRLMRLAGPETPLLYMRSVEYREPYTDYEDTGRLVFLRPAELGVWHSGVQHVFVARASRAIARDAVGFVPRSAEVATLSTRVAGARTRDELREALGGRIHDEETTGALARLDELNADLARVEAAAAPLRSAFQASDAARRFAARGELSRLGLTEGDLCVAWHHLPRARRAFVRAALGRADRACFGGRS